MSSVCSNPQRLIEEMDKRRDEEVDYFKKVCLFVTRCSINRSKETVSENSSQKSLQTLYCNFNNPSIFLFFNLVKPAIPCRRERRRVLYQYEMVQTVGGVC
jgi:hypothetical protein